MIPLDRVSEYSSFAYAVEPRGFEIDGEAHSISRIERAWIAPGARHFVVCDQDNRRFELMYQVALDRWSMLNLGVTSRVETTSQKGVGR